MKSATAAARSEDRELAPLAAELIEVEIAIARRAAELLSARDDLKARLRKSCAPAAKHKWEFPGKGEIELAGSRDPEFKGLMPEVIPEAFLGLAERKREQLIADGVIAMKPTYGSPFYGRVTVRLF